MQWKIGPVAHFSLPVRDPGASARWWIDKLGMEHQFDFDGGVAIGNDAILIALRPGEPVPSTLEHMAFGLASVDELRAALVDLRARGVTLEDPGDEIGPAAPGSSLIGLWFRDPDGYRWELCVQNGAAST